MLKASAILIGSSSEINLYLEEYLRYLLACIQLGRIQVGTQKVPKLST